MTLTAIPKFVFVRLHLMGLSAIWKKIIEINLFQAMLEVYVIGVFANIYLSRPANYTAGLW